MKSRENKGENKEQVMSPQMSTTVAGYIFNSTLAADGDQDCTFVPNFGVPLAYDLVKTKIIKTHFEGMASFFS